MQNYPFHSQNLSDMNVYYINTYDMKCFLFTCNIATKINVLCIHTNVLFFLGTNRRSYLTFINMQTAGIQNHLFQIEPDL